MYFFKTKNQTMKRNEALLPALAYPALLISLYSPLLAHHQCSFFVENLFTSLENKPEVNNQ
jgi:hypothetical protein